MFSKLKILIALAYSSAAYSLTPPPPDNGYSGMYAAPNGNLLVSTKEGIFRSIDKGESWKKIEHSGSYNRFNKFVGAAHFGVIVHLDTSYFYSRDFYLNWEEIESSTSGPRSVSAVDGRGNIYACNQKGVLISKNYGQTWSPLHITEDAYFSCRQILLHKNELYVAAVVGNNSNYFTRIFYTTSEGKWEGIDISPGFIHLLNTSLEGGIFQNNKAVYINQPNVQFHTDPSKTVFTNRIYRIDTTEKTVIEVPFNLTDKNVADCKIKQHRGAFLVAANNDAVYIQCGDDLYVSHGDEKLIHLKSDFDYFYRRDTLIFGPNSMYFLSRNQILSYEPISKKWVPLGRKGLPEINTWHPGKE